MARARPATQRGLNMEPSAAAMRRLTRIYARIDRAAFSALRGTLPAALASGDPRALETLLQSVQDAVDTALPDTSIAVAARRVAAQQDTIARKAFFPALAKAARINIAGTDESSRAPEPARLRADAFTFKPIEVEIATGPSKPRKGRKPTLVTKLNFAPEILSNEFVEQNVRLISTLRGGVADGVRDAVVRANVFGADDPEELARRLLRQWERNGVPSQIPINRTTKAGERVLISARKHAALIANDQLGTLNFQLARTRQTAAGIHSFVWGESSANEPREDHIELYGRTFTWAAGADGIWPGSEINCQCSAIALVDRDQVLAEGNFIDVDSPNVRGTVF